MLSWLRINKAVIVVGFAVMLWGFGCRTRHEVDLAPVEVKPIHITIDVNLKIDRALEDYFGDVDQAAGKRKPGTGKETRDED